MCRSEACKTGYPHGVTGKVVYMSRETAAALWDQLYGTVPDLTTEWRFGRSGILILFDDRIPFGHGCLEDEPTSSQASDLHKRDPEIRPDPGQI